MQQLEPDLLIAHDLYGHTMEVFLTRAFRLKSREVNRLGRLNRLRQEQERNTDKKVRYLSAGRLLCDIYKSAREYLSGQKDYSLSFLTKLILKETLEPLSNEDILGLFQ